jgi:aminocarboxymuconate-semialdehyde decarboxylase
MIIDVHGHLVPPALLDTIRKDRAKFPSLRLIEDGGDMALAFSGGKPSRPIMKGLSDMAGRLAWMEKQGIDKQVVGGWPDWFGYELPGSEGETWCRLFNDALISVVAAEPRFVPLASVPMQDGARAAATLKAAMAGGFRGAMISTQPRGIGSVLDAKDLDPFWAAADETGAVIHIHPAFDAGESRVNDFGLANGVGRVTDAMVAIARLLCTGHVTRYRDCKFFVPIGAAGMPFVIGRLKQNHKITPNIADPAEGLARIYTDTIVHDPRVLRFLIEMIGFDHVMMGSDMPFPIGETEPMKVVTAAGLKPEQAASINGRLAQKLFGIA